MRFIIEEMPNGKYRVKDMLNGRFVRYGYNNPPLYATATDQATEWQNYHAALGFCQKMDAKNDPLGWKLDIPENRLLKVEIN